MQLLMQHKLTTKVTQFVEFLLYYCSAVSIIAGCLPKSVQTLNLSRNKISTIDGLKELTRLRVLDLSYNCISRIGQG